MAVALSVVAVELDGELKLPLMFKLKMILHMDVLELIKQTSEASCANS
jgi:hypothetical protein